MRFGKGVLLRVPRRPARHDELVPYQSSDSKVDLTSNVGALLEAVWQRHEVGSSLTAEMLRLQPEDLVMLWTVMIRDVFQATKGSRLEL